MKIFQWISIKLPSMSTMYDNQRLIKVYYKREKCLHLGSVYFYNGRDHPEGDTDNRDNVHVRESIST